MVDHLGGITIVDPGRGLVVFAALILPPVPAAALAPPPLAPPALLLVLVIAFDVANLDDVRPTLIDPSATFSIYWSTLGTIYKDESVSKAKWREENGRIVLGVRDVGDIIRVLEGLRGENGKRGGDLQR